jgi:hypothetical protein
VFIVLAQAADLVSVQSELDLSDLLERQSKDEQELEMQHVVLSIPLLIMLLNKLFMLEPNKQTPTRLKRQNK